MVSLQSVNVAIRVNSLYRTAARQIQAFVPWIAERGNWLSAWISACQAMAEGSGGFRSSNSNRRNVLKSFKMRRLAVICDVSLSNL